MATQAITKIVDGYEKLKAAGVKAKVQAKLKTERVGGAAAAIVGGALAGLADGRYRDDDGGPKHILGAPAVVVGSGLAAIAGISGWVPGGLYVGLAGVGGLAYAVGTAMFARGKK